LKFGNCAQNLFKDTQLPDCKFNLFKRFSGSKALLLRPAPNVLGAVEVVVDIVVGAMAAENAHQVLRKR